MSAHEIKPSKLIDDLMQSWMCWDKHEEFYLTKLAPSLVVNPQNGMAKERAILHKLRELLNEKEWRALPELLAENRNGRLRELEWERAQEKEKRKAARIAAVEREEKARERRRQEEERQKVRIKAAKREEEAKARRQALLNEIRQRLRHDFLSANSFYIESCAHLISKEDYEKEKISFVRSWIAENTPNNKYGEKFLPDDEQVAAIAAVDGHIQVVARAGSGKTATLVNRAFFLLKHCRVAPCEILLLAFNRKAVSEIRRRLLGLLHAGADEMVSHELAHRLRETSREKRIGREEVEAKAVDAVSAKFGITLPHVMTFHALAYAIVHPEESPLHDDPEEGSQGLSRAVQQVIDDHRQIPAVGKQVREVMLAHFREDWDRIVAGCYDQSKEELLRFRRSLPRESLGGEFVKSYGEKVIADFLFEHDIAYKHEHNHWWNGINYRPDFTVFQTFKSGVIIEYFGLNGDADYDEMSNRKRAYWKAKTNWTLIEFSPADISRNGRDLFLISLKDRLENQGVQCNRLSEEEIWHRVRSRAIDRFTKAVRGFIGRCRKQSLSPSQLRLRIDGYTPLSDVEKMFLNLANYLYAAYIDRLSHTGEEDFDGLMQRAADRISKGQTLFQRRSESGDLASLRYVCIDEFQDFSPLFYRLLNAIRKQNPEVELFCVGDDWQAINGFAGSDLRFFKNFQDHIGKSRRLSISTNYRSSSAIVAVGNTLMDGLGEPAIAHKKLAGTVLVSDINEFKPNFIEQERHSNDKITPAVLRIASRALEDGLDVVMLNRTNDLDWYVDQFKSKKLNGFLESIRSYFPKGKRERITISSAHKYKGLEKSVVILLDVVARSYPLIHPDWVFSRILGDSPQKTTDEERRLLYVALTRAVDTLVIITDGPRKSLFLEELERKRFLDAIKWPDYPPVGGSTTRLIVKVGNREHQGGTPTFAIKDLLKASGYQWQSTGWPGWAKSIPMEEFNLETLESEVWAERADGIEVRIFDGTETLCARFLINKGNWHCLVDELEAIPHYRLDKRGREIRCAI